MNKMAINIHIQTFLWIYVFISLIYINTQQCIAFTEFTVCQELD